MIDRPGLPDYPSYAHTRMNAATWHASSCPATMRSARASSGQSANPSRIEMCYKKDLRSAASRFSASRIGNPHFEHNGYVMVPGDVASGMRGILVPRPQKSINHPRDDALTPRAAATTLSAGPDKLGRSGHGAAHRVSDSHR
jgi:hypothetical protein